MGLFSSDESETDVPDERVEELVNKAKSGTVTEERLTKTDTSGVVARGINMADDPLIEYLDENEHPHFVFSTHSQGQPFIISEEDVELSTKLSRSVVCITERRLLIVVISDMSPIWNPDDIGEDIQNVSRASEATIEIPFESVVELETIPANGGNTLDAHKINLRVNDSEIIEKACFVFDGENKDLEDTDKIGVVIASDYDKKDVKEANNYIEKAIKETKSDFELIKELTINFYSFDGEKPENFPSYGTHPVKLDDTSLRIGEDDYELNQENIADIREISHKGRRYNTRETPDLLTASYTTTGAASTEEGFEIITDEENHIAISSREKKTNSKNWNSAPTASKEQSVIPEYPKVRFPSEIEQHLINNVGSSEIDTKYTLQGPFDSSDCELRVEGWKSGASEMDASIDASAEEKGKSKGLQIGPFTRSKSTSKSSIEGDISGNISDNTYGSKVEVFKLYEENLIIDSMIKLELHYSEISNIFEQQGGVVIEVGSTTFRIGNVSNSEKIGEAVAFVKEQMETFAEEETTNEDEEGSVDSADKLRELKELHEDGILTDEEFQSKKKELLDDF